jgi:PAS domain S-box-containing protein
VLCVIVGVTAPTLVATVRQVDRQQRQYQPTQDAAGDLLTAALNQETGARGYLLTSRAEFLQPFEQGSADYAAALARLRTKPLSTTISDQVTTTDTAYRSWLAYEESLIAQARAGNVAGARSRVAGGVGKQRFDAFRAAQAQLASEVDQRVRASQQSLHDQSERSVIALALAALIGLAIALASLLWWRVRGRRGAQAERALADTAELFQAALDASDDPIFVKDTEGRHLVANRARAASLNMGNADLNLIGRTVDEFVPGQLAAQIREEERKIITEEASIRTDEPLPQRDGEHVFLTTKNPLYDAAGRVNGIVGVAQDVTEERALQADRERLYQLEHELALTLQQSMVGNAEINNPRVDACARYLPSLSELVVGGDWFDVFELDDDRIGLIIGDVVGRGIDAATVMGQLRSAAFALAANDGNPGKTLDGLDRFAFTIPSALGTTCFYGVIDPANEQLTYAASGHPSPLVLGPDGGATYLYRMPDPPVATMRASRAHKCTTLPFPPGSTLLAYTDGLIERRGETIDDGLHRLASTVTRFAGQPTNKLCDGVIEALLTGAEHADDVAVVVARLLGYSGAASSR